MATPAVDRAYYAAQRADDRFQAALDKAGLSRYSFKYPANVMRLKKAKHRADERYHKAVEKMRANPSIRKLKKKLKRMGRTRAQRRETVGHVKRLSRAARNPGKLTSAPLLKVAREAGAKRVQVLRNKSGKPTGVKFLR